MNFTHIEFYVLFPILLAGYWLLRNNRLKVYYLLIWSYYFYAWWDYRFLSLLVFQAVSDYYVGKAIVTVLNPKIKKYIFVFGLCLNISILAFFKYFNFFVSSLASLSGLSLPTLNIILPLGISFYIFRSITYIVDLYKGQMKPVNSLAQYMLFLSFFPVMVAGPIVRAKALLPQFQKKIVFRQAFFLEGIKLLIIGLFQKIFIADRLALFVNEVFPNNAVYDSFTCWLAVLAYTLQIYLDFQGYSNMAIGISRMLGINIPQNFDWPYIAHNISDFWRRWHITLSTWIRDYIYIPLGGNRKGEARTLFNLMVTMTLCGLWHGAEWTFVFWGFFHGVTIAIRRIWLNLNLHMGRLVGLFLTQLVVIIGWVFFRAENFSQALHILSKMFIFTGGVQWLQPVVIFVLLVAILVHVYKYLSKTEDILSFEAWYTPILLFSMLWLVIVFPPEKFEPFVYGGF